MSREVTVEEADPSKENASRARKSLWRALRKGACAPLAVVAAAVSTLAAAPNEAQAQVSTFYLDRLYMAGAPDDAIALWRPQMGERTRFYGQLGLGFGLNPFRVSNHIEDAQQAALLDQKAGAAVSAQLIGYLDAGVEILNRFSFQVGLPVGLVQLGNATSDPEVPEASDSADLKTVAIMDMRLDARVIVFRSETKAFKLGAVGSIWVPTGDAESFDSDKGVTGLLGVAAEYDLKTFFLTFNTGIHFRPDRGINEFEVGSEWRYGLGAFVPLRDGAVRLGAQIFGSTGITDETAFNGDNSPIEWAAEARFATDAKKRGYVGVSGGTRLTGGYAPDFRIVAVAGTWFTIEDSKPTSPQKKLRIDYPKDDADTDKDGLPDNVDLCPTIPEDHKPPNTDDGCAAPDDRDGDGIPDSKDKCPDEKEDFDKVDDADGCPEDDADKDNIGDAQDACPKEPGEPSPEPAKNGCPQFIRRISGSSEIQILKQVQFATSKATILPNSYPILDEVVRLLNVNPEIKSLAIEGHTDNRGPDELNRKLSDDRANSVMKYLIEHGIAAGRLSAQGFGPSKPIADNNTPQGRQTNRRVEFHIRDKSEGSAPNE